MGCNLASLARQADTLEHPGRAADEAIMAAIVREARRVCAKRPQRVDLVAVAAARERGLPDCVIQAATYRTSGSRRAGAGAALQAARRAESDAGFRADVAATHAGVDAMVAGAAMAVLGGLADAR